MNNTIPDDVRKFFESSSVWDEKLKTYETYEQMCNLVKDLSNNESRELLGVAVSYVSTALNEISIYQNALKMLQRGKDEKSVDRWLEGVGYPVSHNLLGKALITRIAGIFQNVIQVIQNFIKSIMGVLNMTLDEVSFTFSVSPSVSLKFK